jgi:hypothetical protein
MHHCKAIIEEIIDKLKPDNNTTCDWLLVLLHWCCNSMESTSSTTAEPDKNASFFKALVRTLTSEDVSKANVKQKLLCLFEVRSKSQAPFSVEIS